MSWRSTLSVLLWPLAWVSLALGCEAPAPPAHDEAPLAPSRDPSAAALCPPESAPWGDPPPRGLRLECRLPDGTLHGKYATWDLKGRSMDDGSYDHGQRHGHWLAHHNNGRPASEGRYERGQKVGLWTSWAKNGTVRERAWYEAGRVVTLEQPGAGQRPAPGSPATQPAQAPQAPR